MKIPLHCTQLLSLVFLSGTRTLYNCAREKSKRAIRNLYVLQQKRMQHTVKKKRKLINPLRVSVDQFKVVVNLGP
jgi:cation transport ATPase